jgi:hypothetical protein
VAADLAGSAHFGGPANVDANGQYYVLDMHGTVWGQPLSADGYTWSRSLGWVPGTFTSQGLTQPMSIDPWVSQE